MLFRSAVLSQNSFDGVYYMSAKDFIDIPDSWELNLVGVVNNQNVSGIF